jgi:hypothetical protein
VVSREIPEKFLLAFSFAGEQRQLVRSIAEAVEQRLGFGTVFFDEWFEYYIAGADADIRLQDIYSRKSELLVVCVSGEYGRKPWTLAEHEAVRGLEMQLRAAPDEKDSLRILPLRVGDGDVKGVPFNTICPDIRKRPIEQTRELIINRLRVFRPDLVNSSTNKGTEVKRLVYLAECTPDLEDLTKPVNRDRLKTFLQDLGWTVLPSFEYPMDQYPSLLEQDLRQCSAFVQLRGPYAWKRGNLDRLQNDAAVKLEVRRFLYRSSEIDLVKVEPQTHREFLSAPEVISGSFDDFLVYLNTELNRIGVLLAQPDELLADPPLIRVVTRSANPDQLWEQVFQWIYVQEKILSDYLAPGESFQAKHDIEPCQGFLIICDAGALEEGPMSPRSDMEQCRLIQIKEKDSAHRPPVAVVYWPPPAPSWARLLRSVPQKLYYAAAESREIPPELSGFFAEVRRIPR